MDRSLIRTPETWARFDFFALIISIILVILFVIFWIMGKGPSAQDCCGDTDKPVTAVVTKPTPSPTLSPIPTPQLKPYSIEFSHSNGFAKMTGQVALPVTQQRISEILKINYSGSELQNSVEAIDHTLPLATLSPEGNAEGIFFDMFDKLSEIAAKLQNGKLGIDPTSVRLSGTTDSREDAETIEEALSKLNLDGRQLAKNIDVDLPEPIVIDCNAILKASSVEFDFGSDTLTEEGKRSLDISLQCLSDGSYLVVGHTDSVGSEQANQQLSLNRAKAAAQYLVSKGVDSQRLEPTGEGEASPVAENTSPEGRAKNRRLEFRIK